MALEDSTQKRDMIPPRGRRTKVSSIITFLTESKWNEREKRIFVVTQRTSFGLSPSCSKSSNL